MIYTVILFTVSGALQAKGEDTILYTERQCRLMIGNVKSVTSTDNLFMEFDEEGNMINYGGMSFYIDPVVWFPDPYTRFERRKETSINNSNTKHWKFDTSGRLTEEFEEGDDFYTKVKYEYKTPNDLLPCRIHQTTKEKEGTTDRITDYEYLKRDKEGNWTKRKVRVKHTFTKSVPEDTDQEPETESWSKTYNEKAKYVYHE